MDFCILREVGAIRECNCILREVVHVIPYVFCFTQDSQELLEDVNITAALKKIKNTLEAFSTGQLSTMVLEPCCATVSATYF